MTESELDRLEKAATESARNAMHHRKRAEDAEDACMKLAARIGELELAAKDREEKLQSARDTAERHIAESVRLRSKVASLKDEILEWEKMDLEETDLA